MAATGRAATEKPERQPRALDQGGFARLDVSGLHGNDREDEHDAPFLAENAPAVSGGVSQYAACGWCVMESASGEYLVVIDNSHYSVCPTCWGRSPGYLELREVGFGHDDALHRVVGEAGNEKGTRQIICSQ